MYSQFLSPSIFTAPWEATPYSRVDTPGQIPPTQCMLGYTPHPTPGGNYRILSTSGRYASPWNAFLFYMLFLKHFTSSTVKHVFSSSSGIWVLSYTNRKNITKCLFLRSIKRTSTYSERTKLVSVLETFN